MPLAYALPFFLCKCSMHRHTSKLVADTKRSLAVEQCSNSCTFCCYLAIHVTCEITAETSVGDIRKRCTCANTGHCSMLFSVTNALTSSRHSNGNRFQKRVSAFDAAAWLRSSRTAEPWFMRPYLFGTLGSTWNACTSANEKKYRTR